MVSIGDGISSGQGDNVWLYPNISFLLGGGGGVGYYRDPLNQLGPPSPPTTPKGMLRLFSVFSSFILP